jgi:GTP diphosphokinase / guanosine-3',5'-bis(diphosphate) 3'-diphosphatase
MNQVLKLTPEQTCQYRHLFKILQHQIAPADLKLVRSALKLSAALIQNKVSDIPQREKLINSMLFPASIVAEDVGLGATSILAVILRVPVENEVLDLETVRNNFGLKPAELIEGLLRIAGIDTQTATSQAENFRQLIISLATDVRVILIKIAERLYLMRNLDVADRQFQLKISWEAFNLYAPLAHRLGLYNIKSELEDFGMKYTDPENYALIELKIKESAKRRNRFIKEFILPIENALTDQNFKYDIKSRTKGIWSIWNKMRKQNVDFEEIYDVFAIRIILDSEPKNEKSDCWRTYSIVADLYQPNPLRLRDWISIPKNNGYESLHTTVVVQGGVWVEVQIRTKRMDEIAEKGFAAHWKYKGGQGEKGLEDWLGRIREVLESSEQGGTNLVDEFKLNLYDKEVFVFTPKGDLKKYPRGATILDFAFDIHTQVGSSCVGARVNGKNVPIRYILSNGDKIEILTSKNQKPKLDWLEVVVTTKAKSRIRLSLKEEMLREAENGKEIIKRRLKNWKLEYNDDNMRALLNHYKLKTAVDLFYLVATEQIEPAEIKNILIPPEIQQSTIKTEPPTAPLADVRSSQFTQKSDDFLVIDEQVANLDYKLAKCCTPIFGDEIFGFVTISEGIKIHRVNCPNARQLVDRFGYRVVRARWAKTDASAYFETSIRITGIDEMGVVSRISDVISKDLKVNMRSISIESSDGLYEGTMKVLIKDKSHLEVLLSRLTRIKGVLTAARIQTGN